MKNESAGVLQGEKHILLDNAINDIDGVGQYAYEILQRIQGNGSGVGENSDTAKIPNLQDVLDNGHHKINTKMTEIRNTLNEIEATLF